jgi:hypothetical protein
MDFVDQGSLVRYYSSEGQHLPQTQMEFKTGSQFLTCLRTMVCSPLAAFILVDASENNLLKIRKYFIESQLYRLLCYPTS